MSIMCARIMLGTRNNSGNLMSLYSAPTSVNREEEMLTAVQKGQVDKVQQLIDSGLSPDTVLHLKVRGESASILATAAYEGQIEVMLYLLQTEKADPHFQDPLLGRNALHWAVMGRHLNSVQILLDYRVDINCPDRDKVTPLIRVAIAGHVDITKVLLSHGANVNQYDRLHSSALHYASFHGRGTIVSLLIKAGCIQNNTAIFGQGTPLANLVYHRDYTNCRLLVEAGYSLKEDSWIKKYDFPKHTEEDSFHIGSYLMEKYTNPSSLSQLCLTCIRQRMKGMRVQTKIQKLPLPQSIIRYLLLADEDTNSA